MAAPIPRQDDHPAKVSEQVTRLVVVRLDEGFVAYRARVELKNQTHHRTAAQSLGIYDYRGVEVRPHGCSGPLREGSYDEAVGNV